MTTVNDLAAYLMPRLEHLVEAANSGRLEVGNFGLTAPRSDLNLVRQLSVTGIDTLSDSTKHRLLFEIAQRRGWVGDADFNADWLM